jgi:CoA:oxalate CoA-transferase
MAGPLSGIKVLDFTWALAGPYGSMILTDLGAEVWKIETIAQTERRRGAGPYVHDVSTYFFSVNRGKKRLMLDLKAPEATDIVHALVRKVDVLTENFSPGTMDNLGFGYEALAAINPQLIYASTSGFGHTGPYRSRGAVDAIVQGMGGVMSMTGHEGGPPARAGYSIGDMAGGMYTAIGVLSALVERGNSGLGQHVDVAMLDAQVALMENAVVRYTSTGDVPGPVGFRHPLSTPHQAFPVKDGWIVLANVKDHDWDLFCGLVGCDELATDERFTTNPVRTRHYAELEPILFEAFRKKTQAEWYEILHDVALLGPMNQVDQVVADPQLAARNMVVELPTWTGGTLRVANTPVKHSRTPGGAQRGAARPGEHSKEILEAAGFTAEEVEHLLANGVIRTDPAG